MPFVLDASVAFAFAAPDEIVTLQVAERLSQDAAVAPAVWAFELANAFLMNEASGRYARAEADAALARLALLEVAIDQQVIGHAGGRVRDVAREHRLTVYDASYLELALRGSLPLATIDRRLAAAAARAGVPLIE